MRNAMNDIIVFENLCFRPSTRKREASVFKALHLKDVFSVAVLPKKVDGKQNQREKSPFSNKNRFVWTGW